jgi:anti-sigma28 factor (negative regulator of flagellin synthesis)
MSIRIHNDAIGNVANSQTGGAEGISKPDSSAANSAAGITTGYDQVSISSLSGSIAESSGALAQQQAARVSQLAELYAKGQYDADPQQLSRALISGALRNGSVQGSN